jgi:hypothetical protein
MRFQTFKLIGIHCFTPLFIGGLIYIFFRSNTLNMFNWFEALRMDQIINDLRVSFLSLKPIIPEWIIYSLPDGLWVYSFTSGILIIWGKLLTFWLIAPLLTGVLVEFAQLFQFFPGTFDIIDFLIGILAFTSSILIFNLKSNKHEKQSLKTI